MARQVEAQREPRRVRSGAAALLLAFLGFGSLWVGIWAQLFPQSFYDSFPGFGRVWVSVDGAYNEHLIRDVGGLNLGLAAVALVAAATMLVPMVRAVAVGYLLYGVPHLLYHATHLSHLPVADQVGNVISLGSVVAAAIAVLVLSWTGNLRRPAQGRVVSRASNQELTVK